MKEYPLHRQGGSRNHLKELECVSSKAIGAKQKSLLMSLNFRAQSTLLYIKCPLGFDE